MDQFGHITDRQRGGHGRGGDQRRWATAFIQKAFSLDQLGAALEEVLPSPSRA
jgi:hypothetical protein